MSVYAPNSDITLISAPLTYGDANQIDFATLSAQSTYFNGLAASGAVYSDCTYQRKDGYIRVPALAENLYNYNYCFYTNFNGKRIYAFITKIEFVNQNCTNVYIKTDVFQTWLFDFTFKQCLVVREHTTTDVPYEHTLPEPIDAGDAREICRYKATPYSLSAKTDTEFDTNYRVVFCLSEAWGNTELVANMYGGVPKTAYYYGFDRTEVRAAVHSIVQRLGADSIIAVYPVPIGALNWSAVSGGYDGVNYYLPYDKAAQTVSVNIPISGSVTGYGNFKNMKCLNFPYHYYRLWSANGDSIDLKPQNIYNAYATHTLTLQSSYSGAVSPSVIVTPRYYDYNGFGEQPETGANFRYSANYTDFPQIAIKTSVYENFIAMNQNALTMNKLQIGVNFLRGALAGAANPGTLPGIALNAAMENLQIAAQMRDMERQPDNIKGSPQGNSLMLSGGGGIFISEMACRPEYLAIVDGYFTQFGYYVHELKTPQFKSRPNHNYIETRNCDIIANMPQDDADELRKMFNAGLTVWHKPSTFGDYTQNNAPA